jgi:hypothetical protein
VDTVEVIAEASILWRMGRESVVTAWPTWHRSVPQGRCILRGGGRVWRTSSKRGYPELAPGTVTWHQNLAHLGDAPVVECLLTSLGRCKSGRGTRPPPAAMKGETR